MKVSFDFDDTLSKPKVQEYAKELINKGIEVYIVTARYSNDFLSDKSWLKNAAEKEIIENINNDLFEVANNLNIKQENIIFMNMFYKNEYLKDTSILWHLDDNEDELIHIRADINCKTLPINVLSTSWKTKCEKLLKKVNDKI